LTPEGRCAIGAVAMEPILVDACGHRCPVPTLKLRRALAAAPPGALVQLVADDPMAQVDVPFFVAQIGARLVSQNNVRGKFSFLVSR
jgi:tRNA 2-thiouridine synthesizing protein A